jgi:hypothetical protein
MRIICLFLCIITFFAGRVQAQASAPASKEAFINATFLKVIDSAKSSYYLVAGADTCRFEKFDYDEWVKYYLQEDVPLTSLNELSYKVHLARNPYYWRQDKLKKAICINARQADSLLEMPVPGRVVFSISQPQFTDDGQYAVIDINWKTGLIEGAGYTFLFRHDGDHWRQIAAKQNWGGDR